MADTAGILRLMRHAATRLAEEEPTIRKAFSARIGSIAGATERMALGNDLASAMAASAYAQAVLRLVANFMTTDDEPAAQETHGA